MAASDGNKKSEEEGFKLFCGHKQLELETRGLKFPTNSAELMIEIGSKYWAAMTEEERAIFQNEAQMQDTNSDPDLHTSSPSSEEDKRAAAKRIAARRKQESQVAAPVEWNH